MRKFTLHFTQAQYSKKWYQKMKREVKTLDLEYLYTILFSHKGFKNIMENNYLKALSQFMLRTPKFTNFLLNFSKQIAKICTNLRNIFQSFRGPKADYF